MHSKREVGLPNNNDKKLLIKCNQTLIFLELIKKHIVPPPLLDYQQLFINSHN
jgi:hypothetical protein